MKISPFLTRVVPLMALLTVLFASTFAQYPTLLGLDMRSLDNRNARLTGPNSLDVTFSTTTTHYLEQPDVGTYQITINPNTKIVAHVRFDVDSKDGILNVEWKDADASQTGGDFTSLPSAFYALTHGEEAILQLLGPEMTVNIEELHMPSVDFQQVWKLYKGQTGAVQTYTLFPGDYELITGKDAVGQGNGLVTMEVLDAEEWSQTVKVRPWSDPNATAVQLANDYFDLSVDKRTLFLKSKEVFLDYNIDNFSVYHTQRKQTYIGNETVFMFPGDHELQIGSGEQFTASVDMVWNVIPGALDPDVFWADADSSMGDSVLIDSAYVHSTSNGDTLRLNGVSLNFHLSDPDMPMLLTNHSQLSFPNDWTELELFPGDYLVESKGFSTMIRFEIGPDGIVSRLQYSDKYDANIPAEELHGRFYSLDQDSMHIHGMEILFDMEVLSSHDLSLIDLEQSIEGGNSETKRLLPGEFTAHFLTQNTPATTISGAKFKVENRAGGLANGMTWNDIEGGSTGGEYVEYPPEDAWLRLGGASFYHLPGSPKTKFQTTYAVPNRQPNGAWYALQDDMLHFLWKEEYEDANLHAIVYDRARAQTPLSLTKAYGDNRYAVDFSALTTGFYML
ncbi:MAG: hypothetical protein AAF570_12825, partial [Bacteroidota bacterium]